MGPDGTGGNGGDGILSNTLHEVHGLGGSWVGGGDMGFSVSGSKSNFVDVLLVRAGEDLTGWSSSGEVVVGDGTESAEGGEDGGSLHPFLGGVLGFLLGEHFLVFI